MFFWRRDPTRGVKKGGVYRRVHRDNLVELAEVTWIGKDMSGIPHVRFQIYYVGPDREEPQGSRMLSLACFAERYSSEEARAIRT